MCEGHFRERQGTIFVITGRQGHEGGQAEHLGFETGSELPGASEDQHGMKRTQGKGSASEGNRSGEGAEGFMQGHLSRER